MAAQRAFTSGTQRTAVGVPACCCQPSSPSLLRHVKHCLLHFCYCRSSISDSGTLPLSAYGGAFNITTVGAHPEDHGTSHLSVVDADRWGGPGCWAALR